MSVASHIVTSTPHWKSAEAVDLLVIQGTTFCNIDCRYCYLPNRDRTQRMSHETLHIALQGLRDNHMLGDRLMCLWHSGEPLTGGRDYMERAFEIVRETLSSTEVTLALQTNGLLVDDAWIQLFKGHAVDVGLSCDGPPDLHDAMRIDRRGRGTSASVEQAAHALRIAGLPLSVICVLSALSLKRAQDIYNYFEGLGVTSVAFNIEEPEGVHLTSSMSEATEQELVDFLQEYFALAARSEAGHKVRELRSGVKILLAKTDPPPSYEQRLFRIMSLGANGEVSCLSPELASTSHPQFGPLSFANVHDPDWVNALRESDRLAAVTREIEDGNTRCRERCSYFELCGGGAPSNKLAEHGTFNAAETLACRFYVKAVVRATTAHLRQCMGQAQDTTRNDALR